MKEVGQLYVTLHADTKPLEDALRQLSEAFGLAADHLAKRGEGERLTSGAECLREPGFRHSETVRGTTINITWPAVDDVERFKKAVAEAVAKLMCRV